MTVKELAERSRVSVPTLYAQSPMEALFLEGVDEVWDGPLRIGRDGTLVTLPAGSDAIEVVELL